MRFHRANLCAAAFFLMPPKAPRASDLPVAIPATALRGLQHSLPISRSVSRACIATSLIALCLVFPACQRYPSDPLKATKPYPQNLKQGSVVDIQVIPNVTGGNIKIVNPTASTYSDFEIWINQRYTRHVDSLSAGENLVLPIDTFWDERGEGPFPGGWFRYFDPTPIVLVQIQTSPDAPLIGLISKPPDSDKR